MPKIDIAAVRERIGVRFPAPFAALTANPSRRRMGDDGGLVDFAANLTRLPPGEWSSQRHWRSHQDE